MVESSANDSGYHLTREDSTAFDTPAEAPAEAPAEPAPQQEPVRRRRRADRNVEAPSEDE